MDAVVLYPQIGKKEDAASAAGSLHAKVAKLITDFTAFLGAYKSNIINGMFGTKLVFGNYSGSSSQTNLEILNITGKRGQAHVYAYLYGEYEHTSTLTINATIDGVLYSNIISLTRTGDSATDYSFPMPLYFNNSCLITMTTGSNGTKVVKAIAQTT